jgi:hypothetical protein
MMSHSATVVLAAATSYSVEGQAGKQGHLLKFSQGKPLATAVATAAVAATTAVSGLRLATTAATAAAVGTAAAATKLPSPLLPSLLLLPSPLPLLPSGVSTRHYRRCYCR